MTISPKRAGTTVLGTLFVMLLLGAVCYRLALAVRTDLHADLAWMHVGAPEHLRSRARHWYPLTYSTLDHWTQVGDADAAQYAFETIAHFGGMPARLWLRQSVDRDGITTYFPPNGFIAFEGAFGLNDVHVRAALALRAARHVASEQGNDQHFDAQLLSQFGADALPAIEQVLRETPKAKREKLYFAMPYDRSTWTATERKRAKRVDAERDAYELHVNPEQSEHRSRLSIAAERLTNGNRSMLHTLAAQVNGDLRAFDSVDYMPNLVAVAKAFPNSRLNHGYRAYDALRGDTYFLRNDNVDAAPPIQFTNIQGWRNWLRSYADHPGADDAAYWLGRSLQARGDRVAALRTYAAALERHLGDGDMSDVIAGRFLWMLDVATTDRDLSSYVRSSPKSTLTPIVNYARAVRAARAGKFRVALALAPADIARDIATAKRTGLVYDTVGLPAALADQRQMWQRLTTASRDQIAAEWNGENGWEIGYLTYFNGFRQGGAGYLGDSGLPAATLAKNMRAANRNAHIITYATEAMGDPQESRQKHERERIITALYEQIEAYPDQETEAMGALPELPPANDSDATLYRDPIGIDLTGLSLQDAKIAQQQHDIDVSWIRQEVYFVREYVQRYPHDVFAATALLSAFEVTGQTVYLDQLISLTPQSDRVEEARALLWRAHQS